MTTAVKSGSGRGHDPRTLFKSPKWMAGSQVLGPSFTVFPAALAGRWAGNRIASTETRSPISDAL